MLQIKHTTGANADFESLCRALDQSLDDAAGGHENRAEYVSLNLLSDAEDAFVAYVQGEPVGCAAFKPYSDTTAEVKRVFVLPAFRGQNIARRLMDSLEAEARSQGYRFLILETSRWLEPAIEMYQRRGYRFTDNYGPYVGDEKSVCMKKPLAEKSF